MYIHVRNRRIDVFWLWVAFLACVIAVGLSAAFLIMTKGLVVTNLADGSPWGLWIIFIFNHRPVF